MPDEIERELKKCEQTLYHWQSTYPNIVRGEMGAKVAYEIAWAEAIDKITKAIPEGGKAPTVAVMEAEATRICAKELRAKREAEAEAEIAKKLIGIAEMTLTSIQTRAKLTQIELGLAR